MAFCLNTCTTGVILIFFEVTMSVQERPWAFLDAFKGKTFTGEWPTLTELFTTNVSRFPDRACFTIYEPHRISLSYKEAYERILKVASYLNAKGIIYGDKVALSGKNSPEWAIAYLGILYAGATVVPIDYMLKNEEIQKLLMFSDSKILFIDEEKIDFFLEEKQELLEVLSLSPKKDKYIYTLDSKDSDSFQKQVVKEDDLAAILFTSGTTGAPKGVMLSHKNLVSCCFIAQTNLIIYPEDVFYALLPIHHSYTMLAVFIEAISVGAEVVFAKRMVTHLILKDLKEAKITMFLGVPLLFNKLLAGILKGIKDKGPIVNAIMHFLMFYSGWVKKTFNINPGKRIFKSLLEKASLYSIRICICGGGPLAPSVFKIYNELGIDFIQGYGLTETSPIVALNPKEKYKEESVGNIFDRVEVKILNPDERGVGEIALRGPMVMKGYYKRPDETDKVFTYDGWFKTGDLGYLDSEKYLYLSGRAKNMIVTEGGKNVYPEEIENAFQLYDEIEQVLVCGYDLDAKMKKEGIEVQLLPSTDFFNAEAKKLKKQINKADIEKRLKTIVETVNGTLQTYQRITKVTILTEALEMTTTKKIKRT